jgi:Family of unknown function (DUF6166)
MKVYKGKSDNGRKTVSVDDKPLAALYPSNPRRNVPFDWGIESPGSRHLAEALLADCTGKKVPGFLAKDFEIEVISKLPARWEFKSEKIEKWLRIKQEVYRSVPPADGVGSASAEAAPPPVLLRPSDFPDFPVDPLKQHRPDWLESLRERIKPDELAKHGFPRPKEVRLSRGTDSTGEDAFYVFLVFPDKTPDEALAWKKIEPMVSWVRDLIWTETGERLWPYVKVKRQKELTGGVA